MRNLNPEIALQTLIGKQLRSIMQCDALFAVRHACQGTDMDFQQRSNVIANSMMVSADTMPQFYNICQDVQQKLGFQDTIEFHITGNQDINAESYLSEDRSKPHIIIINSGLFNLMNEDELRFIIGHEMGHLINEDIIPRRQFSFIYLKEGEEAVSIPTYIENRMDQFNQLAEYGADRYGYLACENLEACISAFYKLNSGINLQAIGVSIDSLIKENSEKVDLLLQNRVVYNSSHPGNPFRVQALILFATCKTQKALDDKLCEMLELLPGMELSDADYCFCRFVISAGYMLAEVDGKVDKREQNLIIEKIAEFYIQPSKLIRTTLKEDRDAVLQDAVNFLKDQKPEILPEMIKFLAKLSIEDGIVTTSEIDFITKFGVEILEMELPEICSYIEEVIATEYNCCVEGL